ncbi:hypothetical protein [Thalassomonas sp. RHCl1]|uniref:hypothetical protein n=1 Tax=Thalassomonas sp. RHCl1 TaxID=2995320 RepID=UPI00248CCDDB|nr:hypothetical protein [Thalassomonas sp. RHCl1]
MSNLILPLNDTTLAKENNVLTHGRINEPVFINETNQASSATNKAALALEVELDGEGNYILGYN